LYDCLHRNGIKIESIVFVGGFVVVVVSSVFSLLAAHVISATEDESALTTNA
jgi:hypothetical protein